MACLAEISRGLPSIHHSQKRQNGSFNPTSRKIASAASADRPRQSGDRRPSYHRFANSQHWLSPITEPRWIERLAHHASTSTSDRKYRIVAHVYPTLSQKSDGRTTKCTTPSVVVKQPSLTPNSTGTHDSAHRVAVRESRSRTAATPNASQAQLAQ